MSGTAVLQSVTLGTLDRRETTRWRRFWRPQEPLDYWVNGTRSVGTISDFPRQLLIALSRRCACCAPRSRGTEFRAILPVCDQG
jgi:hypothetical protein